MTHAWLAGLAAGYGIAVPLGAIAVMIVALAARSSFRLGAAAGLGAATADLIYASVAATTGYALAPLLARMAGPMRLVGAVVLIVLAVRGLRGAWRARAEPASTNTASSPPIRRTYAGFLGLTLLNPLTVLYFAALVVARQASTSSATTVFAFVVGVFLASLSWQTLLAAIGAALHHTSLGGGQFWTGLVGNALIAIFAVHLALAA